MHFHPITIGIDIYPICTTASLPVGFCASCMRRISVRIVNLQLNKINLTAIYNRELCNNA